MRIEAGQTVLLTGATGGLGTVITEALVRRKVKLALVAYPGNELEALRKTVSAHAWEAASYCIDLRVSAQRRELLEQVRQDLGPLDILINNAGVEFTCPYHELSEEQIADVLAVNLEAPMMLSRLVLPQMLERGRGHIVNMSSLASKCGPACQEPYAATKAGLVGFTASLRATYAGSGVSASVILPGFVEAGIYARLKERSGCSAPALLAACPTEWVAKAVLRCIEQDIPELIINRYPVRPLLMLSEASPRLGAWLTGKLGVHNFFRRIVAIDKARNAQTKAATPGR